MDLFVSQFAAWAPGLERLGDWASWAEQAELPVSDAVPPVKSVPAMTRRRLTRWGRLALEVATSMQGALDAQTPVIFSSRHGDTHRTQKLLQDLAQGEPLSPTAFSLSVHNAALGLFTIIERITAPSLALAAGRDTLAHAWVEAQGWLAQGAPQDRKSTRLNSSHVAISHLSLHDALPILEPRNCFRIWLKANPSRPPPLACRCITRLWVYLPSLSESPHRRWLSRPGVTPLLTPGLRRRAGWRRARRRCC